MAKMLWRAFSLGFGCFVLNVCNFAWPESICLLITLVLFIALLVLTVVAGISGFKEWRKCSRFWAAPSLVCLVCVVAAFFWAPPIGEAISDRIFERHVIEYSKVVDGIRNGTISCQTPCEAEFGFIQMENKPTHVRALLGARCDDGGVSVLFLLNTDVILHHEGYLFRNFGTKSNCNPGKMRSELDKYYIRHIAGPWYHFSD